MSTTQRKRRGGAVNSRRARKRNRLMASTSGRASEAQPTGLGESAVEVVDLTGESSDPAVSDLTHSDSAVIVEGNQRQRRNRRQRGQQQLDICILISDDEDETGDNDVPPGTVSCPVCLHRYSEIMQSGRRIVSTTCGHVFCSRCLRESLGIVSSCPTCRQKLTHEQYHPIYI